MRTQSENKERLDNNTMQYIKRLRLLQIVVLVLMCATFLLFSRNVVISNQESLKEVAVAEVRETMKETIGNLLVKIDTARTRMNHEAEVIVKDTASRIYRATISDVADVAEQMKVCGENYLGLKLQAVYRPDEGDAYHLRTMDETLMALPIEKGDDLYRDAMHETLELEGKTIILFFEQKDVDALVKEEIRQYVHAENYEGNQYVWVNEVLNMEGGSRYAIRRIHPNLEESEGHYLSTSMQDAMGNYPYKTELEGIRKDGYVFHSYFFKNIVNDEIAEKFSYSQYYEPFNWIVSTGETIEDLYEYSVNMSEKNVTQIVTMMVLFLILVIIIFAAMVNILEHQAKKFHGQLVKQNEVLEDIYSTMSAGLLRIRMTDSESTIIKINPMCLQLMGMDSEEELEKAQNAQGVSTMSEEDAAKLVVVCHALKEQWESEVVECLVTWKDGSEHLLRIRNMLVEYDGDAKIIQRMYQDITEEHRKHVEELQQAEEKATLDPMTQIKNKRAIEQITRTRIGEAVQKNLPIAVGFVDIDNFRDYNTKYGHLQGDEVIKYVARVLKESVKGDVGRTGGDEFTFCILDTSYEIVEATMKMIHKRLNEGTKVLETGEMIPTPCSIGVVIEQSEDLEYDYIMKRSDEAMYQAKERGKNIYNILSSIK